MLYKCNGNVYDLGRKWEKVGKMFFGSFVYSIDNKGRLVIPSKFRLAIGATLYALRGYDKCLSIYPEAAFEKLQHEIESLNFHSKASRDFIRVALGSTMELTIDDHGRIQIPTKTANQYQLSGSVVVVGVHDHIEIWSEKAWDEYREKADAEFETTSEGLVR